MRGISWRQTTYYPFLHASNYGRGTALFTQVNSPGYKVKSDNMRSQLDILLENNSDDSIDVPYVDAVALVVENGLTIFAVNKNLKESMEIRCLVNGFDELIFNEHIVLTNSDLKACNTGENPDKVVPENIQGSKVCKDYIYAELPSQSWNVIRLSFKGSNN